MTWRQVLSHPQLRDRDAPLLFTFAGSTRLLPLVFGAGLFACTIALSFLGPINWRIDNGPEVYGFLALSLLALVAGYLFAVRGRSQRSGRSARARIQASPIVVFGSLLYFVLYPLTTYDSTGKWFPDIWEGLTDPGQAYADKTWAGLHIPQVGVYLGMVVSPLTIAVLPLTLFFFPRLSRLARVCGVAVILLTLAVGVARAVNQDVGELCGYIVLFLGLVASTARGDARSRLRRVVACGAGIVLVCSLFFVYYDTVIHGRVAADTANSAVENPTKHKSKKSKDKEVDRAMEKASLHNFGVPRSDSVFYSLVPGQLQPTGYMFTSYLTQGYKGLSLAMDSPWHPTWGMGFSIFIRHNVSRVLGLDEDSIEARTYEGQLDAKGWPAGEQWSTFFVHPASDITFPGVVALMALMGFGFGLAWRDMCARVDPVACVVFFYLGIQVLYLSANNQLYQGGELAIGFTVAVLVWLLARRHRVGVRQPQVKEVPVLVPESTSQDGGRRE